MYRSIFKWGALGNFRRGNGGRVGVKEIDKRGSMRCTIHKYI